MAMLILEDMGAWKGREGIMTVATELHYGKCRIFPGTLSEDISASAAFDVTILSWFKTV